MTEIDKQPDLEAKFSRLNIVIVGLPGSGKSSLIESLSNKPNYLSLGDITRAELLNNGPMAEAIREKFQTTEPWPADFVIGIVAPHLLEARAGFVLDGVPRKASEAIALTNWSRVNAMTIDLLLHLQIDPEEALERIASRNNTGRLETTAHYESRMKSYLLEEEEMLQIMRDRSRESLTINTNNNPPGLARSLLLSFIASNF